MKMKMNSVVKLCTLTAAICAANVSYAAGSKTANVAISANVVGSCTITATPVNFGSYDANSAVDTFSTGTITLICVKGSQPTVSLSKGLSPNGAQRRMVNAVTGDFLNYGLYKPANTSPEDLPNTACATTETAVNNWDEDKPSRLHPPIAATADPATYNICGAIPKEQTTVSTGDYTDTVTATIHFD
jgi:spore coat protein U-like protein